ncbi:WSC-domain-containing protein [Exidia glandulosa HHB12029]|uniref:WSC-domain-containing protein n=1 Tax=Exidia glandulosa HHB12029 TaxID=1314781 RepID=A0A165ZER7_EXIGL|nr:WSC-domain-containing protein [Exidia glandulosa HHB12029]
MFALNLSLVFIAATSAFAVNPRIVERTNPPTALATVDNFENVGCFVDTEAGTLSFELMDLPTMTVDKCVTVCNAAGFILAGLTGGTQCFCGNIIKGGGTAATMDNCAVGCGGDATTSCGGVRGKRMLIYEKTPVVRPSVVTTNIGAWDSVGCFSDSQQNRALHHDGGGSDGQTVEDCLNTCAAAGLPLAGVESGLQCFCGSAVLNDHLQLDDSKCNIACAGAPSEMCGGLDALNLYKVGDFAFTSGVAQIPQTMGDWTFFACSQEASSGPREIPTSMNITIENMSVETCLNACSAAGFNVGGIQFGQECRCGNVALPAGAVMDDSACNIACTANANEFCGGRGANQVYFLPTAEFTETS